MRCNLRVDEFPDAELAKLWREPITLMEIAARLGVMEWDVVRVARRMRLPSRKRCKKSSNLSVRDPTRMEIAQRMLEVQATWCEQEEVSQHCWRRKLLAPPQGKPLGGWRHKPSVFPTHKLSRVRDPFPQRSQSRSHSKNPAGHKGIGYAPWDWWAICDCQRTDKGR